MLDFYCFTSSNTHQQQKTQTDEQQRMKQPCRQLPCHGHQLYCRSVLSANDSECFGRSPLYSWIEIQREGSQERSGKKVGSELRYSLSPQT
jgi:hypothetical protein